MSPKQDNPTPEAKHDVSVNIPHEPENAPPTSAPPLPILDTKAEPVEPQPVPTSVVDQTVPPAPAPEPVIEEFHEPTNRHWGPIAGYVILALLVATGVVLGGRWIYHKASKPVNQPQPVPANTNKLPAQPGVTKPNNGQSSTNTSPSTGTGTSPNPSGQTVPTNNAAGNLPNNGPGNVIAIFAGTAIAAAGLHYLIKLRQTN